MFRPLKFDCILKISPAKTQTIQIKILIFFSFFCSKHRLWVFLDPPRRGGSQKYQQSMFLSRGSNEYHQSMFLSRNKKNNEYPCKPQFYFTSVGFKGVKIIQFIQSRIMYHCITECLFVLWFYDPVNPIGSCRVRSVCLTTLLLDRLSPPRG